MGRGREAETEEKATLEQDEDTSFLLFGDVSTAKSRRMVEISQIVSGPFQVLCLLH